jgi:hypothetical protein
MIEKNSGIFLIFKLPKEYTNVRKINSSLPNIFGTKEKSGFSKKLSILEFLCCQIISSTFKKVEESFHSCPNILGTLKKSS